MVGGLVRLRGILVAAEFEEDLRAECGAGEEEGETERKWGSCGVNFYGGV